MTLLLLVALILPMAYLSANLADSAAKMFDELGYALQNLQPHAPVWMKFARHWQPSQCLMGAGSR
jgi:hypothetical protein